MGILSLLSVLCFKSEFFLYHSWRWFWYPSKYWIYPKMLVYHNVCLFFDSFQIISWLLSLCSKTALRGHILKLAICRKKIIFTTIEFYDWQAKVVVDDSGFISTYLRLLKHHWSCIISYFWINQRLLDEMECYPNGIIIVVNLRSYYFGFNCFILISLLNHLQICNDHWHF